MSAEKTELDGSSSTNPLILQLLRTLTSCSKSIDGGDLSQSQTSVSELVNFLDSISDAAVSEPENEDARTNALEILSEINKFLCSPSLNQEVIDVLSFELPKSVSKFAGVSSQCLEIADSIIDRFIKTCSPRDMLSILCEGLDSLNRTVKAAAYVSPLVSGLSEVFLSIQRRHFEQIKVAVPVIVKVVKAISSESDYEDTELETLFDRVVKFAQSIQEVSTKLQEAGVNEKLRALLGLYILQILALVSVSPTHLPFVLRLVCFLPYCGVSYLGLITGSDVETMSHIVIGEGEDDCLSFSSDIYLGASLSVIWAQMYDEVAQAAKEDLGAVKTELQNNQMKRWKAIGMLKCIFSSVDLPWEFRRHAVDFLLYITSGDISNKLEVEHDDCSLYMTNLFSALKAVTMIIIYTSDAVLRKNAFEALKRVLADIPNSQRFDILKALITNSVSSSMVAILLDLVRGEMHRESTLRRSGKNEVLEADSEACQNTLFWSTSVLELVESVLMPVKGGPPVLPENGDAVLSALNLYRFVLMTESSGKTNYTGVLSKNNLQKAYKEWFLPLRVLVTGIVAENKSDNDQLGVDTVCALNPVELVLYRCIELVEENLKHST